ncbi:BNR-4 repeat-containing protein [Bacillus sp. 3255]|uniref:BNR-4 repeat-containing protein n=1 Tax=Bacillus sp. 3255 TaxID=2817904 RepID=UPI00286B466E|nr:BNR-4 repeat-containing protein [Bacillus sp. 3255]
MKKTIFSFLLAIVMSVSFVSIASAESVSNIASNGSYHNVKTFGAGLYDSVANKTFITYSGPEMDVYVKAYNHLTNVWESAIKVYDWNDSSTWAYHDYPTMVLLPDGKLALFIFDHTTAAYMIKAPNTHSLSGTWTRTVVSNDLNAYPMPVVSGNDIYLFYSRNDDVSYPYRTYRYIKSSDNGTTWSIPSLVIDSGKTSDKYNEVYAHGVYLKDGKIYISWQLSGGPEGHNKASKDLYLAYLDTETATMHNVAGSSVGNVVNAADMDSCKVVTATPISSNKFPISVSQPSIADDGTVVIGFGRTYDNGTKKIELGKFVSGAWSFSTVTTGTTNFKDMVKSGSDDFEVLYINGTNIDNRKTTDMGSSWSTLYTLGIPYISNADSVNYANFIENRNSIRVIAGTINVAERQTDYTGKWGIFAIKAEQIPPTVYANTSYSGSAVELPEGTYTMAQLTALGIGNDSVSSLKVPFGYRVTGYADDNFTGSSWIFTADDSSLVDNGCNDMFSSIRVEKI